MKRLQVILEFMATASSPSEVRRVTRISVFYGARTTKAFAISAPVSLSGKSCAPRESDRSEKDGRDPLSADLAELMVDIETPDGKMFAIDDPALIEMLLSEYRQKASNHIDAIAHGP